MICSAFQHCIHYMRQALPYVNSCAPRPTLIRLHLCMSSPPLALSHLSLHCCCCCRCSCSSWCCCCCWSVPATPHPANHTTDGTWSRPSATGCPPPPPIIDGGGDSAVPADVAVATSDCRACLAGTATSVNFTVYSTVEGNGVYFRDVGLTLKFPKVLTAAGMSISCTDKNGTGTGWLTGTCITLAHTAGGTEGTPFPVENLASIGEGNSDPDSLEEKNTWLHCHYVDVTRCAKVALTAAGLAVTGFVIGRLGG